MTREEATHKIEILHEKKENAVRGKYSYEQDVEAFNDAEGEQLEILDELLKERAEKAFIAGWGPGNEPSVKILVEFDEWYDTFIKE